MNDSNVLWLDIETTGLDHRRDLILEIAMQVGADTFERVIKHSWSDVKRLAPDIVWQMHEKSGLLDDLQSEKAVEPYYAWSQAQEWLRKHPWKYLAGCGIDLDRRFLDHQHLELGVSVLETRVIDVSSIRRAAQLFDVNYEAAHPKEVKTHRAMADIRAAKSQLAWIFNELRGKSWTTGFEAGLLEGRVRR